METAISIRALTEDDWQTLAAIRLEALQDSPQYFSATYENESKNTPEQWRNWLKPGLEIVFGLFDGTKTIGMTGLMTTREDAAVGQCIASYINPSYRRRGLSGMLYKARIDWAFGHLHWRKLVVPHREGNEASRRANQKWGFVYTKTEPKTWPDGTIQNELCYELDLEQLRQKKV